MKEIKNTIIFFVIVVFLLSCSTNDNWPQFLGPDELATVPGTRWQ
jgi:hypothetical protein